LPGVQKNLRELSQKFRADSKALQKELECVEEHREKKQYPTRRMLAHSQQLILRQPGLNLVDCVKPYRSFSKEQKSLEYGVPSDSECANKSKTNMLSEVSASASRKYYANNSKQLTKEELCR
jgi:hypothetical protein